MQREPWSVELSTRAAKDLDKLTDLAAERVRAAIIKLAANPFGPGVDVKKLKGTGALRLRVGSFRILYYLDARNRALRVLRVTDRKDAY